MKNKGLFTFLSIIGLASLITGTLSSYAARPPQTTLLNSDIIHAPEALQSPLTEVKNYIPLDLEPTQNTHRVTKKIVDHSVNHVVTPYLKKTNLGKVTAKIEKKLSTQIEIKDDDSEINHKFNVQLLALQSIAQMKYSGLVSAKLNYNLSENVYNFMIDKKLFGDTYFVYSHLVQTNTPPMDSLTLRWSW